MRRALYRIPAAAGSRARTNYSLHQIGIHAATPAEMIRRAGPDDPRVMCARVTRARAASVSIYICVCVWVCDAPADAAIVALCPALPPATIVECIMGA